MKSLVKPGCLGHYLEFADECAGCQIAKACKGKTHAVGRSIYGGKLPCRDERKTVLRDRARR